MNILGWDHWHILTIDERKHDIHVQAEPLASPGQCLHCGSQLLYRHEKKSQLFLDLPIRGKRVGILVLRRRYRCRHCSRTFFEHLDEMDDTHLMTKRLVNYVQQEALRRTFASIALEVGLAESTIRALFDEFAGILETRYPQADVTRLGIDELYLLHKPRCVICDVGNHRAIEVLPKRTKTTVVNYLQHITAENRQHISTVSIDMWVPYAEAVRLVLPHAQLVIEGSANRRLATYPSATISRA